jgi:23S rRNA (adenine2503-C2)-methyltransferase
MADEGQSVKLAVSLHSLDNEKRTLLMPLNKKYPVPMLMEAVEYYWRKTRRKATFEYILFDEFNDSENDVEELAALSRRIPCKVNIIPFHSIVSTRPIGFAANLRPASPTKIQEFAQKLRNEKLTVMVRRSAGQDIDAACGQLAFKQTTSRGISEIGKRQSTYSKRIPENVS